MNIVKEYPPFYLSIIQHGMNPNDHTFFTYGDTIFNPHDLILKDHSIAHEEQHSEQQGDNPQAWWDRYLADPYFRIDQEAEAYARQFNFMCKTNKDREKRFHIMLDLSRFLASPLYGSVIGRDMALKLIKDKVKK
ncbi:hypothetical protein D4R42_00235 [bacterium]|nr:MAG: hypothetical protein D4R42_00235 [bacterium]